MINTRIGNNIVTDIYSDEWEMLRDFISYKNGERQTQVTISTDLLERLMAKVIPDEDLTAQISLLQDRVDELEDDIEYRDFEISRLRDEYEY